VSGTKNAFEGIVFEARASLRTKRSVYALIAVRVFETTRPNLRESSHPGKEEINRPHGVRTFISQSLCFSWSTDLVTYGFTLINFRPYGRITFPDWRISEFNFRALSRRPPSQRGGSKRKFDFDYRYITIALDVSVEVCETRNVWGQVERRLAMHLVAWQNVAAKISLPQEIYRRLYLAA
jgi:hypothetical protein